jgi:cell division protein FtsB
MMSRPQRRWSFRRLILPAVAAAYLGYFGFHAFSGSYGIWALAEFDAEAAVLQVELAALRAETNGMEQRAALLRPQSLDPDMIDERARRSLNVIGPNEVVIIP